MTLLVWLAIATGNRIVGIGVRWVLSLFSGHPVEAATRATWDALDAARSAFHEKYGDDFGAPGQTFLDRESNHRRLLRSTFPNADAVSVADLDPHGFDGAPKASNEAIQFALDAFEGALSNVNSRQLDRDRALQRTRRIVERGATDAAGAREAAESTRNQLLGRDEVRGAFRDHLDQQVPDTEDFVREGRFEEAEEIIRARIKQTIKLKEDAGPDLSNLVGRHITALRVVLGNVLAEAADTLGAREELDAIGDPARVHSELLSDYAKLAFRVRDREILDQIRVVFPSDTDARRKAELWLAIIDEDWETVLATINELDTDEGVSSQIRARALIELDRDPTEAASLLDKAWGSLDRPLSRLTVAAATADLLIGIVAGEREAPGIDRKKLVRSATARLEEIARNSTAPLLRAHAYLKMTTWFAFLNDRERHETAYEEFDQIELSERERLHFVVDTEMAPSELRQLVETGVLDVATRDRARALRFQKLHNKPREEAALRDAIEASSHGTVQEALIERLLDIQLELEDKPGAEAVIELLAPDDPVRPLLAAKVKQKFRGRAAARAALEEITHKRPRCRPALRSLFYVIAQHATETQGEIQENLLNEAIDIAEKLYQVLPSRANRMIVADLYTELGRVADAILVYEGIITEYGPSVGLLRAKAGALIESDRLPEAARDLEEAYSLDPSNEEIGSEAGHLWFQAARFDRATETLEGVVDDHPHVAMIHSSLGFARLHSDDEERRSRALESLEEALRLLPELKIDTFILFQAAIAADNPIAARRYMQQLNSGREVVTVNTPDDVGEIERLAENDGIVHGKFESRESIEAFLEYFNRQTEALENIADSDMAPFGAIARRPWSTWLSATDNFRSQNQSRYPGRSAARMPWPSEVMLQPMSQGEDWHPVSTADGLLVDITALLTLASLGATEEVFRYVLDVFECIVLYPGALADLREEVRNVAAGLAWEDRQPYEEVLQLIDRYALGPRSAEPPEAELIDLVPKVAADPLGNSVADVGLALHISAGYVAYPTSFDTPNQHKWGGQNWTSAEVLAALHNEGHLGRSQAEDICDKAHDTFDGWIEAEPPQLTNLVVSGFVLVDWYRSGLFDLWIQNRAEWPQLRVGAFGTAYLRSQIKKRTDRQELLGQMKSALTTLDTLVAEGIVEVLPSSANDTISDGDVPQVWHHALHVLDAASDRRLHVWADDRALGYLVWKYEPPITGPKIDAVIQRLRQQYNDISLLSTEVVLERLADVQPSRTAELGWDLFLFGYRPLLGRLALRHLLTEYDHNFNGPPYNKLLQGVGALSAFLPREDFVSDTRRAKFLQIATVPALDALLDVAWNNPNLEDSERTVLSDAIINSYWNLFDVASLSSIGPICVRLLMSFSRRREGEYEKKGPELWFAHTLSERLSVPAQVAVVRAVEDSAIDMYRGLRDHDQDYAEVDEGDQTEGDKIANRLAAHLTLPNLVPLFNSNLLQTHASIVRRLFTTLVGSPEMGMATYRFLLENELSIPVQEDEIEQAALNAFWTARDNPDQRELLGMTRVHGTWERKIPEDDRATHPTLPDIHPVEVDVPYLVLALRNDVDLHEAVVAYLANGLDFIDPELREVVRDLRPRLDAKDRTVRAEAIEQFADASVGTVAVDLERDVAQVAKRLRTRSLAGLESWLFNPAHDPTDNNRDGFTALRDGRRIPSTSVAAAHVYRLDEGKVQAVIGTEARTLVEQARDDGEDASYNEIISTFANNAATDLNCFSAIYCTLVLLSSITIDDEVEIKFQSVSRSARKWIQEFITDIIWKKARAVPIRSLSLAHAHAYILRLSVHACSGPQILEAMYQRAGQDEGRLAAEWASNVIIASDRLTFFVGDRYRDPLVAASELKQGCERLGFDLEKPGFTFDRLNPMLYGPNFVNHERWLLLHALDVSWKTYSRSAYEAPIWWSEGVHDALSYLSAHPESREDLLFRDMDQNGLGIALDRTPSAIAADLLERSARCDGII